MPGATPSSEFAASATATAADGTHSNRLAENRFVAEKVGRAIIKCGIFVNERAVKFARIAKDEQKTEMTKSSLV